jgi:cellulose synthase/poly-beta-1,6-N-acetylglucosamine synthase-like glycosyltransferase
MHLLFWLVALALVYSYFLYPIVLKLARPRPLAAPQLPSELPSVTLIIAAHNEERRIEAKLANTLAIDYPAERLDIIVASDCSSDGTDAIVRDYAPERIRLVRADQRNGKEYAQLCAIQAARGEILVFSDTATEIPADAIRRLVAWFADPGIGAVSSEDRFRSADGRLVGEGAYVKYEMWLRRLESERGGVVGLSGSFFAVRSEVCGDWDIHSPSDFNTALDCARRGLRAISAPDVLGYYEDLKDPRKEYQRKVRTVLRGITALSRHPDVLNVGRFGQFAFQVWSHKLMRWLVPVFALLLLLLNLALLSAHPIYVLTLLGQLAFYGIALAAHYRPGLREQTLVRLIYFFVQANTAIADAGLRFLRGKRMTTWQPSAR